MLTALQFAVMSFMGSRACKGVEVREMLKREGFMQTGPAFYQMMARLEEAKMVEGWYTQEIIDGQIIKERNYRLLPSGNSAVSETQEFYARDFGIVEGLA